MGLKIYFFAVSERRNEGDKSPPKLIHGREATLGYTISFPRSDSLRNKTPQEIKDLIKTTRWSYLLNEVHLRNRDLQQYEDIENDN